MMSQRDALMAVRLNPFASMSFKAIRKSVYTQLHSVVFLCVVISFVILDDMKGISSQKIPIVVTNKNSLDYTLSRNT